MLCNSQPMFNICIILQSLAYTLYTSIPVLQFINLLYCFSYINIIVVVI